MTSPILRALNSALDEAATVHGIGRARGLLVITLPLMAPALIAAAIYIAVIAIATFEVPAVIGLGSKIYTFSTLVYIKVVPEMGLPEYGVVGGVSVALIVLSLLLSGWYFRVMRLAHRYEVVRGRSAMRSSAFPGTLALGGIRGSRWLFHARLPAAARRMMTWVALLPYVPQPFSVPKPSAICRCAILIISNGTCCGAGTEHTLVLMVTVPTIALLFGVAISWVVVRSGVRGRFLFDWIAFLPHAVPNLIFAIAMVIVALKIIPQGVPFYGTVFHPGHGGVRAGPDQLDHPRT